ncbi:MAG: hypothetical protein IJF17_04915 [Thermoguttaceae bacterium]|nr:hypothetical protein [Thermoguttaceae bacterium]
MKILAPDGTAYAQGTFALKTDDTCSFFRFDFLETGGSDFQLSEITFYGNPNAVPEPETWPLLFLGSLGI